MGDAGQMASCWMPDVKGKERRRNLYYSDESSRIEPLNRSSRREEAPTSFSPNGMSLLTSAATRSTIPESRIGTMNPIVLVLVLVLVLETKLAGRGRVRERGRGRRDGSWRGRTPCLARITAMNRSSRRKEAHSISREGSWSLLTSAATKLMVRGRCGRGLPALRFMESEHLQNSDVSWGHEPTPNPSGGGESMSGTLAEFPSWEGSGVGRFMESLHDFSVAHWDHEPLRLTEARSGPRVCDPQPARFMERTPRTLCAPCALEPTHRPLTPSLSPSAGARVPEGRAGGGFMEREGRRERNGSSWPRVCWPL